MFFFIKIRGKRRKEEVANPGWWLQFITIAVTLTDPSILQAIFTVSKQSVYLFFFQRHPYHFNLKGRRRLHYTWLDGRQVAGEKASWGGGEQVEKSGRATLTSSNSLFFKSYTFTKVMELQHWKIFTPGKVKIYKQM